MEFPQDNLYEIEIENLKDEISELETDMKDIEINGGEY